MEHEVSPLVAALMAKAKVQGEALGQKLAGLELDNWNAKHESELKQHFGYTDKTLARRKKELTKQAKR